MIWKYYSDSCACGILAIVVLPIHEFPAWLPKSCNLKIALYCFFFNKSNGNWFQNIQVKTII